MITSTTEKHSQLFLCTLRERRLSAVCAAKKILELSDISSGDESIASEEECGPGPGGDEAEDSDSSVSSIEDVEPLRNRLKLGSTESDAEEQPCTEKVSAATSFKSRNGQVWTQSSESSENSSTSGHLPTHDVLRAKEGITAKTRITVVDESKQCFVIATGREDVSYKALH